MKHICITDIHGYLDRAVSALRGLEERTGMDLLEDREWNSRHELIVNGDVFDRGPQNREALRWSFRNADVYLIGNHEFFAAFPDVTSEFMSPSYFRNHGEQGLYWREMKEETRHRLLEKIAGGELKAAHSGPEYVYSHSGSDQGPEVEQLNSDLEEAGEKLVKAHRRKMEGEEGAFEEAQREIVEVVQTGKGSELRSRYPDLFDVRRDADGRTATGGIVWNRFYNLDTEVPQVVGHTKGSDMKEEGFTGNPQWRGAAVNINTIRDAVRTGSEIAVTVEDRNGLEVHKI